MHDKLVKCHSQCHIHYRYFIFIFSHELLEERYVCNFSILFQISCSPFQCSLRLRIFINFIVDILSLFSEYHCRHSVHACFLLHSIPYKTDAHTQVAYWRHVWEQWNFSKLCKIFLESIVFALKFFLVSMETSLH